MAVSTLHSYHFYVETCLPKTRVLLWVYGEQLRAVLDHGSWPEYRCRYDWREHHVKEIRDGVFYPTRFASPQGALIRLTPHESLIVYRPKPTGRLGNHPFPCSNCGSSNLYRQRRGPPPRYGIQSIISALV